MKNVSKHHQVNIYCITLSCLRGTEDVMNLSLEAVVRKLLYFFKKTAQIRQRLKLGTSKEFV